MEERQSWTSAGIAALLLCPRMVRRRLHNRKMFPAGAVIAGLTFALFFFYPCSVASAQSACAQLGVDCSHSYSGGYGGGNYAYNRARGAYMRQMAAQRALQRRHTRGYYQNEAGLAAQRRGDYNKAVRQFRKANHNWPDDQNIYDNLQYALRQQAQQNSYKRYLAQQKRQAKAAQKQAALLQKQRLKQQKEAAKLALQRQKEAARLAKLHPPAPPTTPPSTQASSTSFFGTPSNPVNPGLQAMPPSTAGTDTKAMDQLKAMAGTSIQGKDAASPETASTLAGTTPDRGGGNPGDAPMISVSTPHAEEVLSPQVAKALAGDKEYQSLNAERAQASSAADAAQHQLDTLQTQMKSEPDSLNKQLIQIQISNATQKLEAAKSTVRTDDIKQETIKKRYEGAPIILPAATATPAAPAAKSGAAPQAQTETAPASGSK